MARFLKKPVEIEAWQWDETKETFAVLKEAGMVCGHYSSHETENVVFNIKIETVDGMASVDKGDWIIKYMSGQFYPCSPCAFERLYGPVIVDDTSVDSQMKSLIQNVYDGIHRGVGPMAAASDGEIAGTINDVMCNLFGNDWCEQ